MCETPATTIINELTKRGAKIIAYDPKSRHEAETIYLKDNKSLTYVDGKYEALKNTPHLY